MSSHLLGNLTDHSNHLPILVEPEAPHLKLENIYLNDQQQPPTVGSLLGVERFFTSSSLQYHSLDLSWKSSMTVAW